MTERPKKTGKIKKIWRTFSLNLDDRFRESFDDGGYNKVIRAGYRQLFASLRKKRTDPGHFPATFPDLLQAWQITEKELPKVTRYMLLEIVLLSVITAFMFIAALAGHGGLLFSSVMMFLGLAMFSAVIMRFWRYSILKQRIAVPFMKWLGFGRSDDQENS